MWIIIFKRKAPEGKNIQSGVFKNIREIIPKGIFPGKQTSSFFPYLVFCGGHCDYSFYPTSLRGVKKCCRFSIFRIGYGVFSL